MSGRSWIANMDMYRKVPGDLMEQSQQGSIVSFIAVLAMAILFCRETQQFFTPHLITDLALDKTESQLSKIRADFNITLTDIRCEFATINVVSVLGNEQNVTKNVQRWPIDSSNVRQLGVNAKHHDEQHSDMALHDADVTQSLEELHEDGEDAVSLDPESFLYALEEHEFVFVDFFAGWCSHCKRLAPTWEKFAEVMHDVEDTVEQPETEDYSVEEYEKAKSVKFPVLIAKVDCVAHHMFCMQQRVQGYPTLSLFVNGERYKGGQYNGDRTILHMIQFLMLVEEATQSEDASAIKEHADRALSKHYNMTVEHERFEEALQRTHRHHEEIVPNSVEHVGCQLVGSLYMNRVPGHFFIQAQSTGHTLDPLMTNLSLIIHHLSFHGMDMDAESVRKEQRRAQHPPSVVVPDNFDRLVSPMDGQSYVTHELHQSHHLHLKLVPTNYYDYQVLHNSHLSLYPTDRIPEVKFVMDISPIAVRYSMHSRPWYDYVTSILAIVGGSFTLLGMLASFFRVSTDTLTRQTTKTRKFNYARPPPMPPQRAAP